MGNSIAPKRVVGWHTFEEPVEYQRPCPPVMHTVERLYAFVLTPMASPATPSSTDGESDSPQQQQQDGSSSEPSSPKGSSLPQQYMGTASLLCEPKQLTLLNADDDYDPTEDNVFLIDISTRLVSCDLPVEHSWELVLHIKSESGTKRITKRLIVKPNWNKQIVHPLYSETTAPDTIIEGCGREHIMRHLDAYINSANAILPDSTTTAVLLGNGSSGLVTESVTVGNVSTASSTAEDDGAKVASVAADGQQASATAVKKPVPAVGGEATKPFRAKKAIPMVKEGEPLTYFPNHGGIGFHKNSFMVHMLVKSRPALERHAQEVSQAATAAAASIGGIAVGSDRMLVDVDAALYQTLQPDVVCMDIDTLLMLKNGIESQYTHLVKYLIPEKCTLQVKVDPESYDDIVKHSIKKNKRHYNCSIQLSVSYLIVKKNGQFYRKDLPVRIGNGQGMVLFN
jgi:hypothetical protein